MWLKKKKHLSSTNTVPIVDMIEVVQQLCYIP